MTPRPAFVLNVAVPLIAVGFLTLFFLGLWP